MDWMSFFWCWHSRDDEGGSGSKATMTEIYDVIKRACGGTPAWCERTEEIHWSNLRQAAISKWGEGTAKYNNFNGWAGTHGVRD
jgi:hypothetical protein